MKTWNLDMLMSKLTECFSKDNSFQFSSKRRKENNEPSLSHNTNHQHDNTDDDGLSEDIKKCLSFENKEVGDGSSVYFFSEILLCRDIFLGILEGGC